MSIIHIRRVLIVARRTDSPPCEVAHFAALQDPALVMTARSGAPVVNRVVMSAGLPCHDPDGGPLGRCVLIHTALLPWHLCFHLCKAALTIPCTTTIAAHGQHCHISPLSQALDGFTSPLTHYTALMGSHSCARGMLLLSTTVAMTGLRKMDPLPLSMDFGVWWSTWPFGLKMFASVQGIVENYARWTWATHQARH